MDPVTFAKHKELTASDCEAVAQMLIGLAKTVREGNMKAFEEFWISGGTEEGDGKIDQYREVIVLRYLSQTERIEG